MDEFADQLSEILSDPDRVEQLKQMAADMLGGTDNSPAPPLPKEESYLSPEIASVVMKALSAFKSVRRDDNQTAFLLALKPLLAPERRNRVDTALKFMRVFSALPALKESGVLNLLKSL